MERNIYIDNNKDTEILVLPKLPFEEYMQVPNPEDETFIYRFKLFYGINEEVNLLFVPYKSWVK